MLYLKESVLNNAFAFAFVLNQYEGFLYSLSVKNFIFHHFKSFKTQNTFSNKCT